jgi:hypothetical protein
MLNNDTILGIKSLGQPSHMTSHLGLFSIYYFTLYCIVRVFCIFYNDFTDVAVDIERDTTTPHLHNASHNKHF